MNSLNKVFPPKAMGAILFQKVGGTICCDPIFKITKIRECDIVTWPKSAYIFSLLARNGEQNLGAGLWRDIVDVVSGATFYVRSRARVQKSCMFWSTSALKDRPQYFLSKACND